MRLFIIALLLLSGCTSPPLEPNLDSFEPLERFMARHPSAQPTIELWDAKKLQQEEDFIVFSCTRPLELKEYWYVEAVQGEIFRAWIDAQKLETACLYKKSGPK